MDLFGYPLIENENQFNKKHSHFERVDITTLDSNAWIKQLSFRAMGEVEGWCQKEKASVLIDLILMLNAKTVVEIGVFGGKSFLPMAYAMKGMGEGTIFGIDPWSANESCVGLDDANKEFWSRVDHENLYQVLKTKIDKFGLGEHVVLIKSSSENAPIIYDIDLLHIDGNHSEETSLFDVMKWVPHVRQGGLIVFDDLDWKSTNKAVQWLDKHCIRLFEFFKGDNIWAVWVKRD